MSQPQPPIQPHGGPAPAPHGGVPMRRAVPPAYGTPGYGEPQPFGPLTGTATPQPYGPPTGTGTPQAYGAPTGAATPQAYGPPPGFGVPPQQAGYAGQPAYAAQSPAQQQAAQPGGLVLTACRLCGSVPAAPVKFRGHQGMIVIMRFLSTEGPFCRTCGLGVFRHMTSRTLVQGWYGYGSFIITPITVLVNLLRRAKVAELAPPQPNPYGPSRPPMDPGPRLLHRPMSWAGIAIGVGLFSLLVAAIALSD